MSDTKPKANRRPRYVWLKVTRLMDPETGELKGALVPQHDLDAAEIRRRGYKLGTPLRAELRLRRNPKFHRLAHAMAKLVASNVDGFEAECESEDWHGALKRLQMLSGVACEEVEIDATPVVTAVLNAVQSILGDAARKMIAAVLPEIKTITVRQAVSLAFDEMDETEFRAVYGGIVSYVCRVHWKDMDPRAVEEMAMNMVGREAEAA